MLKFAIAALLLVALLFIGGCTTTAPGGSSQDNLIPTIIFLVVIFAIFYFLMVRPQRKRQKEHEHLMQELQKGDYVVTAGGIFGQIESLNPDSVVIKVESGATIRVARGSIVGKRPLQ